MRIAFITDVHFGPRAYHEGKLRKLTDRADELSCRFVERMNAVERPDLVVNLGDVIEDESRERDLKLYGRFVEILRGLSARVAHVAGNHDTVNLSDADLLGLWGQSGTLHYSFDHGGLHFLVLQTLELKDTAIRLPQAQLEFAAADLARTSLPTIVLMHHPASDQVLEGNRWFERAPHVCRVAERKALRRIVEESAKVIAVFNGHVHWNHFDVIGGIPYITVQSLTENLDEDAPGRPARAFAICDVELRRLQVTVHGEETARYQVDRSR